MNSILHDQIPIGTDDDAKRLKSKEYHRLYAVRQYHTDPAFRELKKQQARQQSLNKKSTKVCEHCNIRCSLTKGCPTCK